MHRITAWFTGESQCPVCDSDLEQAEAGYYACTICAAVVDYETGSWCYAGSNQMRRLPGLSGMRFKEPAA